MTDVGVCGWSTHLVGWLVGGDSISAHPMSLQQWVPDAVLCMHDWLTRSAVPRLVPCADSRAVVACVHAAADLLGDVRLLLLLHCSSSSGLSDRTGTLQLHHQHDLPRCTSHSLASVRVC